MRGRILPSILAVVASFSGAAAQSPYQSSADFAKYAMRLRENALLTIEPRVFIPTLSRSMSDRFPWKSNIVTTVFWVGEQPTQNNPVPNDKSSWDKEWQKSFGGYDDPDPSSRRNFIAAKFIPRQNPFYIALPYNDVSQGKTKPEASKVVPWFKETHIRDGQSVCRDRWVAIRKGRRICYAQWSDCGPFRTDHWQYVFGNERPKPNLNQGAGLDVSPAVRDYLGMHGKDVTDWKFVDFRDVPPGPWSHYGENNTFVLSRRKSAIRVADRTTRSSVPTVVTR
jgi:hypothetical protein